MAVGENTLEEAQRFIFITQVYFCAMYAVVIWDWIISLSREWRYVWKTQWTPVKISYLFCRYWVIGVVPYLLYCFVVDHSLDTCQRIFKIPVALAMWNQVASESILLIRTYAFFNRNIYVLWFLIICLAGLISYQLYVDTSQMMLLPFVTPPFEKGPCFPMSKPKSAHLLGFFIAPLLFDTLVTFMTIWKALRIRRQSGGSPNSRLIQTFLREGVFYYILISVANLINGIFYLQPRQAISAINIPLSVMLAPVLAARLVRSTQSRPILPHVFGKILDLRERGAQTVSHSEGSGITAFTAKTPSGSGSPFHATHRRRTGRRNAVLDGIDSDVEMAKAHGRSFAISDAKALNLGGDGAEDDAFMEMGFKAAKRTSLEIGGIHGIRVDVEKTTTTTM